MLFYTRVVQLLLLVALSTSSFAQDLTNIPILCYHNLNPTKRGSMNMTPQKFESQIKWIKDHGYTIIPLKDAVAYLQGKRNNLPPKSVVITADDGWESVYRYMYPIIKKYNLPITLFIYPETISEGKNAMTWEQLKELQQTGLFDMQGHTLDHPNFNHAKRRMSPEKYAAYVDRQLAGSKRILEEKLGVKITLLAWPFGIYNDYLENKAASAGYEMAFTIDALPANKKDRAMATPRFMIVDGLTAKTFEGIVHRANSK